MTKKELILALTELRYDDDDEVFIGYDATGDGIEPYTIVAIEKGYLVIVPAGDVNEQS